MQVTAARRFSVRPISGQLLTTIAALALVGMIVVFAVHGRQWRWTGFAGNTSLWSWLQTFAQPAAFVYLTLRLICGEQSWRMWRLAGAVGGVLLTATIVASYSWHWSWTGFGGKQLWDWLHLMLFPVVVVLLPEWVRKGAHFGPREAAIASVVLSGFVVLLVGGYRGGWTWTGFTGNSFHDWLDLMIAPFLVPLAARVLYAYHNSGRAIRQQAGSPNPPAESY